MLIREFIVAGAVIFLLAVFSQGDGLAHAELPGRGSAWNYKVVNIWELQKLGEGQVEAGLNKLGAEGWELIGIDAGIPKPSSIAAIEKDFTKPLNFVLPSTFYFKRQAKP